MKRHILLTMTATLVALAGCSSFTDPGSAGTPGPLNLVLTTPNSDDGALMLHISGGAIDSVTAANGYAIYDRAENSSSYDVIIQGNIVAGSVATVWVKDQSALGSYSATVEQVATRSTFEQRSLSGYSTALAIP